MSSLSGISAIYILDNNNDNNTIYNDVVVWHYSCRILTPGRSSL